MQHISKWGDGSARRYNTISHNQPLVTVVAGLNQQLNTLSVWNIFTTLGSKAMVAKELDSDL